MTSKFRLAVTLSVALAAALTLVSPSPAHAQRQAQGSEFLTLYMQLPDKHFAPFGYHNRLELLKLKDAIYDKRKNFIEIVYRSSGFDRDPTAKDPLNPNLYVLQVTLFRDVNRKPVIAVSRTTYSQPQIKPAVFIYRVNGDGSLHDTTARDFPFKLDQIAVQGRLIARNYYLPRSGNAITSSLPESDDVGDVYVWTGRRFVRKPPVIRPEGQ